MKEQVARELAKLVECDWDNFQPSVKAEFNRCASQIINLFKAEVDKLTVIPDGDINQIEVDDPTLDMSFYNDYYEETNILLKAQLQADKDKLLESMEE